MDLNSFVHARVLPTGWITLILLFPYLTDPKLVNLSTLFFSRPSSTWGSSDAFYTPRSPVEPFPSASYDALELIHFFLSTSSTNCTLIAHCTTARPHLVNLRDLAQGILALVELPQCQALKVQDRCGRVDLSAQDL